jgi:hypothetical protein
MQNSLIRIISALLAEEISQAHPNNIAAVPLRFSINLRKSREKMKPIGTKPLDDIYFFIVFILFFTLNNIYMKSTDEKLRFY